MTRILLIGVLLVVAIGLYLRLGNDRTVGAVADKAEGEEEIAVKTVAAKVQSMPVVAEAVGTVEPEHRVEVRPEMNGVLEEVSFREGEDVRKG
ncbi:MAG: efflux transporter periplasmic adaptor subunit, partial [Gammaproteobacteria bacterium]